MGRPRHVEKIHGSAKIDKDKKKKISTTAHQLHYFFRGFPPVGTGRRVVYDMTDLYVLLYMLKANAFDFDIDDYIA